MAPAIEGQVIFTPAAGLALAAATAGSSATFALIEGARHAENLAQHLNSEEAAEYLADALQSTLSIELDGEVPYMTAGEREMKVQLLACVKAYLAGWA